LVILTDQQRYPPPYDSAELEEFRRKHLPGVERLRQNGVSFRHHYPMTTACAPSRASLLTGQYPSLHGVTQTDGLAKNADSDGMFWLAPDTVPTLGDWFRAGGRRQRSLRRGGPAARQAQATTWHPDSARPWQTWSSNTCIIEALDGGPSSPDRIRRR
jgi:hypothetical protein